MLLNGFICRQNSEQILNQLLYPVVLAPLLCLCLYSSLLYGILFLILFGVSLHFSLNIKLIILHNKAILLLLLRKLFVLFFGHPHLHLLGLLLCVCVFTL